MPLEHPPGMKTGGRLQHPACAPSSEQRSSPRRARRTRRAAGSSMGCRAASSAVRSRSIRCLEWNSSSCPSCPSWWHGASPGRRSLTLRRGLSWSHRVTEMHAEESGVDDPRPGGTITTKFSVPLEHPPGMSTGRVGNSTFRASHSQSRARRARSSEGSSTHCRTALSAALSLSIGCRARDGQRGGARGSGEDAM